MRKIYGHIVLLLLMSCSAFAQFNPPRPEIQLDQFIQRLVAVQQEDVNYEDIYESLLQFYLNPININNTNAEELRSLNILSEIQINELLTHIENSGKLISLYELQSLPSFDFETIELFLPFISLGNGIELKNIKNIFKKATDSYLVFRTERTLEQARGFTEDKYLGDPQKYYVRYRLQHPKDFSVGFIMEKDQGEPKLNDYMTFHAQVQNKGLIKNAIIGDYQVQFGQSVVMAGGYSAGKGAETVLTTRRSDLGIRPHNSVLENGYLRGTAVTIEKGNLNITAFGSLAKRDASVNNLLSDEEEGTVFSSILTSGLHRTNSEIANRKALTETTAGFNGKYRLNSGHVGFTAVYSQFSDSLFRQSTAPYNNFEFQGNKNAVLGPNFSYTWQNFNFFGEAAVSSSGGVGAVGGLVASLTPKVEWALHFRNYDKDFHSFYGNAFAEGSRNINEKGMYTGLKYTFKKGISLAGFYDKYHFPWLRYLVDAPSGGSDYLLRFTLQPTKKWIFYTQYHRELKDKNMPSNLTPTDYVVQTTRQNLLAHVEFSVNRTFKSQSRIQYNSYGYETLKTSHGLAFMQDLEGAWGKWQLKTRIAYFNTDDYDSRVYAYENDVLYAVSFPAYYGKGTRLYLVGRYSLSRNIDIWARIARTSRNDVDVISSGNNQINAPHRTDTKLQIRYNF